MTPILATIIAFVLGFTTSLAMFGRHRRQAVPPTPVKPVGVYVDFIRLGEFCQSELAKITPSMWLAPWTP